MADAVSACKPAKRVRITVIESSQRQGSTSWHQHGEVVGTGGVHNSKCNLGSSTRLKCQRKLGPEQKAAEASALGGRQTYVSDH